MEYYKYLNLAVLFAEQMSHPFIDFIKKRISTPLPGLDAQLRMAPIGRVNEGWTIPADHKKSAVLILFYPYEDTLKVVLIVRTDKGGVHSGQIALPGGRWEPEDDNLITTALRETEEEVGASPKDILVLGMLTHLYIPVSNFLVQPVLGYISYIPNLTPCDEEVAGILELKLEDVFKDKTVTKIMARGMELDNVPAYLIYNELKLWGATAMMMSELEEIWEEYLQEIT